MTLQEVGLHRHFFHIPKTVGAEYFYRPPDPNKASPKTLEEAVAEYDRERYNLCLVFYHPGSFLFCIPFFISSSFLS
jgi:hypothetical protein